jgi:hypothetical protein
LFGFIFLTKSSRRSAGPTASCCRAEIDESHAAVVAAPILSFVSVAWLHLPDEIFASW